MESIDLFRIFLRDYFDRNKGIVSQKEIAEKTPTVAYKNLNAFINGKQTMGEGKRARIAKTLGMTYEECLAHARKLIDEKDNGEVIPFIEKRHIFKKYNFLQDLCAELQKESPNSELAAINSAIAFLYEKKDKLKKRKRVRREEQR